MAETYLNSIDGKLYIGEAAIEEAMQLPGNELVPLSQVILDPEFPLPQDVDRQYHKNWSRDDCISYGRWILNITAASHEESDNPVRRLSSGVIDRMAYLGLGPWRNNIASKFDGSLRVFTEELGAANVRSSEKYKHWTTADFAAYASELAAAAGGKPRDYHYQQAYQELRGPHIAFIQRRLGGISRLNELIGYPDIRAWEEEDFREWGVKVMLANGVSHIGRSMYTYLSKQKRGPSEATILHRFGTTEKFMQLITEDKELYIEHQAEKDAALMAEHDALSKAGELVLPETVDETSKLQMTAKYLVARRCLPGAGKDTLESLAALSASSYVRRMQQINQELDAGFIESTAIILDVFDYIWPMDKWRDYLKAKQEELRYPKKSHPKGGK